MTDDVSPMVVTQRIRNRIIEYLELASSFDEQLRYQEKVPLVFIPSEIINQWEDWVRSDRPEWYSEPVYSIAESAAIWKFHAIWNSVADDMPDLELSDLIKTEPWERLSSAAEQALKVFEVRGRFDEEREVFP